MQKSLVKLIKISKPWHAMFIFALFCMFFGGIASVLPSWFVKISVDGLAALDKKLDSFNILPLQLLKFIEAKNLNIDLSIFEIDPHNLRFILPISIIAVFALEAVIKFLYQYNIRLIGLKVVKSLREKFHAHISKLSVSRQQKIQSGSLVSVITSDLHNLQSWIAESISNIFNEGIKAAFLLSWLLITDYKLTFLSIITLPLFAIPVLKLGKKIRSYSRSGQDFLGNITTFVSESIHNQRIIKAFNLEAWRNNKFAKESTALYELNHKWVLFMVLVSPLTNLLAAFGIASILFFGLNSVYTQSITVGEFSSFFVTSILLYDPVKRLGRVSTILQSALGVADRVFELLEQPSQEEEIQNKSQNSFAQIKEGEIELKNIYFKYPGTSKNLFEDFSLHLKAKTSLALVGASGGGKSTILSLLTRFYEIDSGEILIDGQNINEISLTDLRSKIAIVTQDPLLFNTSIKENILLGNANLSDSSKNLSEDLKSKVEQAAKDAYVLDFAQKLDNGLDTEIGEQGSKLSIGQRQRVSIARAFFSDAPIVILDEPTSALDNESQEFVTKSIEKLMQSRTVIMIAHRLSTVKNCDQILELNNSELIKQTN